MVQNSEFLLYDLPTICRCLLEVTIIFSLLQIPRKEKKLPAFSILVANKKVTNMKLSN